MVNRELQKTAEPQIIFANALSGFVESATTKGTFYRVQVSLSGKTSCTCPAKGECHHIKDFIAERIRRNNAA